MKRLIPLIALVVILAGLVLLGLSDSVISIADTSVPDNEAPNVPSNPSPLNHAIDRHAYTDLSWSGGDPDLGDMVTYDVYFGTSATPPLVSSNQLETTYDPGILTYSTKYDWQIVATDNHGVSTTGPLWDFTTAVSIFGPPWGYDENWDGILQKNEALKAIEDYFDGVITKMLVLEVLQQYFP